MPAFIIHGAVSSKALDLLKGQARFTSRSTEPPEIIPWCRREAPVKVTRVAQGDNFSAAPPCSSNDDAVRLQAKRSTQAGSPSRPRHRLYSMESTMDFVRYPVRAEW